MTTLIRKHVTHQEPVFQDRREAGRELAEFLAVSSIPTAQVLAIPRGGVATAEPLAKRLQAPLQPVFVRKLPIPHSPEAGFGAIALDGSLVLNESLVRQCGLPREQIDAIAGKVQAEVQRRAGTYRSGRSHSTLQGRTVYLVDDGLASGYTALAAIKMVRRQNPARIIVAVPVAPMGTVRLVEEATDDLHCLMAQARPPFAVASFYRSFPDMTDEQVESILERTNP